MQQTIKKNIQHLRPGLPINGLKNRKKYFIQKKIIECPTTATYLCKYKGKEVIVKVGQKTKVLVKEITMLQKISVVQDNRLGPALLDVDYWQTHQGDVYLFYVLDHLQGINLQTFFKQHQHNWLPLFICQLLDQLIILHSKGFVLGQTTLDDLFVTTKNEIRFRSLNKLMRKGDSNPHNPKYFNRRYWLLTHSILEPKDDLFTVVILVLSVYYPEGFARTEQPKKQLIYKVNQLPLAKAYKQCFLKAVFGKYETATQMKKEFIKTIYLRENIPLLSDRRSIKQPATSESEAIMIFLFALSHIAGAAMFL